MRMEGNTILITGGGSGIGRALAERLHDRGNTVIIAGRRTALLDEVTRGRAGMTGIELDIADPNSIAGVAKELRERFPALNVLFNNAGISKPEDLTSADATTEIAEATITTNITGVLRLTAALLPELRRQPAATILTTTSGLAHVPLASHPAYSASKAFLHSWMQSLRHQLRDTSIEVLEVAPPYVQTELGGPQQATDPNAMPLDDYANAVIALLVEGNTPGGEVLVEQVKAYRHAERDGRYDETFAQFNPA